MTALMYRLNDFSVFVGTRVIVCGCVLLPPHHLTFPGHGYHFYFLSASAFETALRLFAPAAQVGNGECEEPAFWSPHPRTTGWIVTNPSCLYGVAWAKVRLIPRRYPWLQSD